MTGTVQSVRKVIPAALAGRVKRQAHLWIDTIEKNDDKQLNHDNNVCSPEFRNRIKMIS